MNRTFQHYTSFFAVLICSVFFGLSSCENPGAVGSGLTQSNADVVQDTLIIDTMQPVDATSYSGGLDFYSAGQYNDPLFGDMKATAYTKPALPSAGDDIIFSSEMYMRVIFDENQVYGDTTATQQFDIYRIAERWRGRALKLNDNLQINTNNKVASFSVGPGIEDSLDVQLSQDWVDQYSQYEDTTNADSLYKYNEFGLAVVPSNNGKLIPLDVSISRFVIRTPQVDTFAVGTEEWAYSLERGAENIPQGSSPLYSTYESVINFDSFQLSDLDLQAPGVSRAILVLHQNQMAMEQSLQSGPSGAVRPEESTVFLQYADSSNIPENIDPGVPANSLSKIQGVYSESDGTYRFDVTRLVQNLLRNAVASNQDFFVTFPNNGVVKPSLIYTDPAQTPADKKPKIIITSLKNSSN